LNDAALLAAGAATLTKDVFKPREHALAAADTLKWRFPARSVSVVELECRAA